jgi:competence protein ComEC
MKAPLSLLPALPAAIGLSAGIVLDVRLNLGAEALVVAIVAIVVSAMLIAWWRRFNDYAGFVVIFAAVGVMISQAARPNPLPDVIKDRTGTLTMRVERVVEREDGLACQCRAMSWAARHSSALACDFRVALTVGGFDRAVKPGDVINVKGRVKGVADDNPVPDRVDYSRYLFIDGVVARMWAPTADVAVVRSEPTFTERLRTKGSAVIADAIVNSNLSPETEAFLLATVIGDDLFLGDWLKDGFRASGLAHVLALSGLHVGIIVLLVTWFLYPLRLFRRLRWLYYSAVIALIMLYAVIVGMTPSVARAAVMAVVFMVGNILQRRVAPYNYLCITVVIWLLINPYWLFSPGFQMSVLASASIMFFVGRVNKLKLKTWRRGLALMVTVPVAAVLSTSAVSVFYFHTFPLSFLPANCLASLLVTPIIGLGVVIIAVKLCFGVALSILTVPENVMYAALRRVVTAFASIHGGQLTDIYIEPYQLVIYMVGLVALVLAIYLRRRLMVGVTVIVWALFAATVALTPTIPGDEMYIVDTSQSTDIIFRHNDSAFYITTARGAQREKTLKAASSLYRDYLGRRGCDSFVTVDSDFVLGPYRRVNNTFITADGRTILLVDADTALVNTARVNTLLVDKGFHQDIVTLVSAIAPDTVILSRDINATRRSRYQSELKAMNRAPSLKN